MAPRRQPIRNRKAGGGTTSIAGDFHIDTGGSLTFAAGFLQAGTFDVAGGRLLVTAGGSKLLRPAGGCRSRTAARWTWPTTTCG